MKNFQESHFWVYVQRNWTWISKSYLHPCVHWGITDNRQDIEMTHTSVGGCTEKEMHVPHTYNQLPLSLRKPGHPATGTTGTGLEDVVLNKMARQRTSSRLIPLVCGTWNSRAPRNSSGTVVVRGGEGEMGGVGRRVQSVHFAKPIIPGDLLYNAGLIMNSSGLYT